MARTGREQLTVGSESAAQNGLELRVDGTHPLTLATVQALEAVCSRAETAGSGILTFQLSGAPGSAWTRALDIAVITKWERTLRRLERLAIATVAVVSGDCGGAALDVLLVTDYRIAACSVCLSFGVDGETMWPGMAVHRLTQQVGAARIRKAVLFGVPIEAPEALRLGLVDQLAADPVSALAAAAGRLTPFSGRDLAIRRQLMFDAATTSSQDALGAHLAACDRALRQSSQRNSS